MAMDMPPEANKHINYGEVKADQAARQRQIALDQSMKDLESGITPGEDPYKREAVIKRAKQLRHDAEEALKQAKARGKKLSVEEEASFFSEYYKFIDKYANNVDAYNE